MRRNIGHGPSPKAGTFRQRTDQLQRNVVDTHDQTISIVPRPSGDETHPRTGVVEVELEDLLSRLVVSNNGAALAERMKKRKKNDGMIHG